MLEPPVIPQPHLIACLQDHYALTASTLEFLPLGLDVDAGIYRVVGEQGNTFLLKVKSGPFYTPSCLIPRYCYDQGITNVVAPLPTKHASWWVHIEKWTAMLYPFIDGESGWQAALTDGQWQTVGSTFKRIHQLSLSPLDKTTLRTETFNPSTYIYWAREFEQHHFTAEGGSELKQELRNAWQAHHDIIHTTLSSLETLGGVLQRRAGPYVICHADMHPGNLIRAHTDQVFVIDWDDVMLAPKERDFLFVGNVTSDATTHQTSSPFFQGYGAVAIDWVALTYYRWERVIQDLIACTNSVFFRNDLSEATRAKEFQLFCDVLSPSGEVQAARDAAAHLSADYTSFHD